MVKMGEGYAHVHLSTRAAPRRTLLVATLSLSFALPSVASAYTTQPHLVRGRVTPQAIVPLAGSMRLDGGHNTEFDGQAPADRGAVMSLRPVALRAERGGNV